jgi:hypothetical protein
MSQQIIIKKVDDSPTPSKKEEVKKVKGGKTMKTFPKGILKTQKNKIKGVSDPAKSPPLKKGMKTHSIRLITDKGAKRHRKTVRRIIAGMSNEKVKELVNKNGLLKNEKTPPSVMREMLEGGAIAGFVSLS